MRSPAVAVALAALAFAPLAGAHDEHPHLPGSPEDHDIDQPPPDQPEVVNENLPTEGKPAPAPAPGQAVTPAPSSDSRPHAEGWRPRSLEDNDWRHSARANEEGEGTRFADWLHFWIEMRFGPYWPAVDDEEGLTGTPYADFFGDDPQFYFGLEVDWLPLYLPYVASIGPGFGWGFTSASGAAKIEGTDTEAGSDTSLTIFPMHASLMFRFDGPLRELNVPIVPYVKLGIGFGIWSTSGGSSAGEGDGASYGPHVAIGGAIALNAFDRATAIGLRQETGIRYAYLWGEWMYDDLGSLGPEGQMNIGTSTGVVGLAVDF